MKICEIFKSIQGESTWQGMPCIFIRLSGCNLRCKYCDTTYAFVEGREMSVEEVLSQTRALRGKMVEITGGEPLLQEEVYPLMERLLDEGHMVLLETNGSRDISRVDPRVQKIMDIKCPASGMVAYMNFNNIDSLRPDDEVKFVLTDYADYEWAKQMVKRFNLTKRAVVLFSPAYKRLDPQVLARWILDDNLTVRLQLQLHKYIWGPDERRG